MILSAIAIAITRGPSTRSGTLIGWCVCVNVFHRQTNSQYNDAYHMWELELIVNSCTTNDQCRFDYSTFWHFFHFSCRDNWHRRSTIVVYINIFRVFPAHWKITLCWRYRKRAKIFAYWCEKFPKLPYFVVRCPQHLHGISSLKHSTKSSQVQNLLFLMGTTYSSV